MLCNKDREAQGRRVSGTHSIAKSNKTKPRTKVKGKRNAKAAAAAEASEDAPVTPRPDSPRNASVAGETAAPAPPSVKAPG